jgi:hypothetical protein
MVKTMRLCLRNDGFLKKIKIQNKNEKTFLNNISLKLSCRRRLLFVLSLVLAIGNGADGLSTFSSLGRSGNVSLISSLSAWRDSSPKGTTTAPKNQLERMRVRGFRINHGIALHLNPASAEGDDSQQQQQQQQQQGKNSIGNVVGNLHGGKYQFDNANNGLSWVGKDFAESLYRSHDDEYKINEDDSFQDESTWPQWAVRNLLFDGPPSSLILSQSQ